LPSQATQGAGGAKVGGRVQDKGSESAFSVTLRIVMLSALLLLAINAVVSARRLNAPAVSGAADMPFRPNGWPRARRPPPRP
jgi:hypothetical protein